MRLECWIVQQAMGCTQVWELDRKLLQAHALGPVAGYTWEMGTLLRALAMDEFAPAPADARLAALKVTRRIQRAGRYGCRWLNAWSAV